MAITTYHGAVRENHLAVSLFHARQEMLEYLNRRDRTPDQILKAKIKAIHRATEAVARIEWRDDEGVPVTFEELEDDLFGHGYARGIPGAHRATASSNPQTMIKDFQEWVMRYV